MGVVSARTRFGHHPAKAPTYQMMETVIRIPGFHGGCSCWRSRSTGTPHSSRRSTSAKSSSAGRRSTPFSACVFRTAAAGTGALSLGDLLVVTLIADAAQNAMASEYKSITEGAVVPISTIVGWDYF